MLASGPVLPDVVEPGLKAIIGGTAAGNLSGRSGTYYAQGSNRFWEVLYTVGLTDRRLSPAECRTLAHYGIGLTDIVKTRSGTDATMTADCYDVEGFRLRIQSLAYSA